MLELGQDRASHAGSHLFPCWASFHSPYLDLHCHLHPIPQHSKVHLPHRGSSKRHFVKGGHPLTPVRAQFFGQHPLEGENPTEPVRGGDWGH